jgi:NADPH:quinone reductase-like Zn-dependent oxidoreductase
MSEYFTSPADCLVDVPADLAELGFLVEPISITEKALELAYASRSSFGWAPETALVLGNGSLGLLTVAMLCEDYEVYCVGRRDRPDPTIDIIEGLGATYVDSRETPVAEFADVYEPADLVYEATGYAKHATDSVAALGANGVAALPGVPEPWEFEIDGENGKLRTFNDGHEATLRRKEDEWGLLEEAPFPEGESRSGTLGCIEELVAALDSDEPTSAPVEVAATGQEVCLGWLLSHLRDGARVELPIENRQFRVDPDDW